jgi:hypothetical protein
MSLSRAVARQVPPAVRAKGAEYFSRGAVVHADGSPTGVEAIVRGTRPYRVRLRREGTAIVASCECKYFADRASVCKHIWALILDAEQRGYLQAPGEDVTNLGLSPDTAGTAAAGKGEGDPPPWERFFHEVSQKLARAEADARPSRFHDAEIIYAIDRGASLAGQSVALDLMSRQMRSNGKWGRPKPAGVATRDVAQLPDPLDREIIPLLLGASDVYGSGYVSDHGRASFRLAGPLVDRVLPLIAQSGRAILRIRRQPTDELIPLTWDDGPPWVFRLEVGHVARDERVSIDGALERSADRLLIREPTMVLPTGYLVHAGRLARLDARGAFTLLAQLRGTGPLTIPPGATGQLVDILARSGVDPADLPEELQFEVVAHSPRSRRSAPTIAAERPPSSRRSRSTTRGSPWTRAPAPRASTAIAGAWSVATWRSRIRR